MPRSNPTPVETADERRRRQRIPIEERPLLTLTAAGRDFHARIEDISLEGARLRVEGEQPPEGEIVISHPRAGELRGRCAWRGAGTIGVTFDEPKSELERTLQCLAIALFADESA